MTLKWATDLF